MASSAARTMGWVEQGLVPDAVIRAGIRRLLRERLAEISVDDADAATELSEAFVRALAEAPIALVPDKANEQHYEIPPEFFGLVLGPHRKYSSAFWPADAQTLGDAEAAALATTSQRAELADGQRILELGCGWGSLTLWMAAHFPASRITAVSNSAPQREYILGEARQRGLANVEVITADMNAFEPDGAYDRIVSVEMFEHMRNWPTIFRRLSRWLTADGRFFMHVFTHRTVPYAFVERDESDWMSRYFFSGGMMPSEDLALRFQDDLKLLRRWRWSGTHYERTANAWLANLDANAEAALRAIRAPYGADAPRWLQRWRIFFMSCAELFGYERGQQWGVTHYLFEPRA